MHHFIRRLYMQLVYIELGIYLYIFNLISIYSTMYNPGRKDPTSRQ